MIQKFTQLDFNAAKSLDMLKLECEYCHIDFLCSHKAIKFAILNASHNGRCRFCSINCKTLFSRKNRLTINCKNCCKVFTKTKSQIKSENSFCCQSCSASYTNKHKTYGVRKSKLEKIIEAQLKIIFPDLEILFNNKTIVKSELDIYIPSLNVAFEINGIFHYKPIYGTDKLLKIQKNDMIKSKSCLDKGISLYIIDVSEQKYVTIHTSKKYLEIITKIISYHFVK